MGLSLSPSSAQSKGDSGPYLPIDCYPGRAMCRSIKKLRREDDPATDDEIHEAALQFVRKVSGYQRPSRAAS